jgi:hypothetical protein
MPTLRRLTLLRRVTLIAAWASVLVTIVVLIVVPSPSIRIPLVTVLIIVLMALASLWLTAADS